MTTWAIGDIQGCFAEFDALLARIDFEPKRDKLWLAGDLVNRGPDSLRVLRFVHTMQEHVQIVLGNHDLHLLAASVGARKSGKSDTLQAVLSAPDRDELLDWLRRQPLVHHDLELGWTVVHAGIPVDWTVQQALARAAEVESLLQGEDWHELMFHMYGDKPARWRDQLSGYERARYIINAFTRMRYVDASGRLDFAEKNPPGEQASGLRPWYELRVMRGHHEPIVFGHWATLQVRHSIDPRLPVRHVDHGCVWGGRLVAYALETGTECSVPGIARERRG
ncbi:MAG: symmetrical bis(5'-nucleosyl)-tetraphosphatase [Gammaproteobacteria bacterium]|nr:symmetrical bis(5'-nucleosyl)-tetraphosphatase [Gammaproteobacteria bacterium]